MEVSLLVIILVISFQAISIRHIGLVFLRWQFQSVGLRIGYIVASFYWEGICPELKQSVTISFRYSDREGERFLIISYEMPKGPVALSFDKAEIVEYHFSSVGLMRRESYMEMSIDSSGVYIFCHKGVMS